MNGPQIIETLQKQFGADQISVDEGSKAAGIFVSGALLLDVMRFLRDEPALTMDFLNNIVGCDMLGMKDYEGTDLRTVYHLYSYPHRHELVVSVNIDRDDPTVLSLSPLWASAVWQEREAYDLVGIIYDGHPNLTRILLPTEFEGHPLRKDWRERSHVMGIETTRQTPVELLKFFHEKMGGEVPPGLELDLNPPTVTGNVPAALEAAPKPSVTEAAPSDSPEAEDTEEVAEAGPASTEDVT